MKHFYPILFVLFLVSALESQGQYTPLEFVANEGQWDGAFRFKAETPGGDVYLEDHGITYMLSAPDNLKKVHDLKHGDIKQPPVLKYHAYRVRFEGSAARPELKAGKLQKHYYNYFLGNKAERWKTGIHPALTVDYEDIYPGIDLHVASENRSLKYDFIVEPGADPGQILLAFSGADALRLKKGRLEISTSVGVVQELEPFAFQYVAGERRQVACRYRLRENKLSFEFPKGYDAGTPLIIDPTVVFATYSGSTADNWGFSATYDAQGNFYAGGIAAAVGYPVSTGAFQSTYAGGGTGGGNQPAMRWDIAISKFNPTGSALIYSTYLGGSDNEQPHSLVVDNSGNLIVAGRTFSADFPLQNAYQNTWAGNADIVISKFNAGGTALIGSTYMGGGGNDGVNISTDWSVVTGLKHNYGDDARSEVIVDNSGNVYVAASTNSGDFPVLNATQNTLQGGQDGVVFKLNPNLSNLLWSTYLGGTNDDAAYVLALNVAQSHIYVSGGTTNVNFPSTPGTFQPAYGGGSADGYIVKFQNSGTYPRVRSTFIGMSQYDQCYGIQVDKQDRVYAMGQTVGGQFPVTPGVYVNPKSSQFIIKLDSNLSTSIYSTVFGTSDSAHADISPVAFLVDTCEQVYISGWGGPLSGNGGSTTGMPITANAADPTTDGQDFYFIVLSKDATALLYGTFYGSPVLGDHVDGGTSRFDRNGVVYQGICAGCPQSSSFPTTPGVVSNTNNSPNCNYGALKISFDFILLSDASAYPDTSGCAPLTVSFNNNSLYATSYIWDFGDGSPVDTSVVPPPHTFTAAGTYTVKLIAFNTNACNQTVDTDYITIIVDGSSIAANFTYDVLNSCDPYEVSFTNTSSYSSTPGSQTFTKFIWDFGDGTSFTGATPPVHNYPDTGTYIVRLLMIDTTSCNNPDSVTRLITLSNNFVQADFIADSVCLGGPVLMSNGSSHALSYHWNFGDTNTSVAASPQHVYAAPGVYTVTLVASNPGTCNQHDTATQTVQIWPIPVAAFTHAPVIPVPNEPIRFTNESTGATSYFWAFGDGRSSTVEHPTHMYKRTGTYKVCLEASNEYGCVNQYCRLVDAEVHPVIDVPTGFSPNGDGSNDVLFVRGGAVETVHFRVFNRWGEKVFEMNDMEVGWDGNFKGKPQEMDAYAWVLDATFVDGSTVQRTGNVTLIR